MIARARAAYEALTPFGRLVTLGPALAVLLLATALVGMCSRGGAPAPARIEGAAPGATRGLTETVEPPAPASVGLGLPSVSPVILPPADLAALLRGGDVARVAEGERDNRSSVAPLALTTLASESGAVAASSAAGLASAPRWEPGLWGEQLTPAEVYGLAVEVTGDHGWASFASRCFTGGGENRGYVGAVSPVNKNGTQDLGLGQSNTNTLAGLGFEASRVLEDPHYAMQALHATYEVQGYGAWLGCAPGVAHGDGGER